MSAFPVGPLRFATLFSDVTEARRVQEELRSDELRLQSLVRILQYDSEDDQDFLDFALAEAVDLSRSRYGYIYLYDEDSAEFSLNSWSGLVMEHCAVFDRRTVYCLSETGFLGEAVRRRAAIGDNDFAVPDPLKKGYPAGHVAITRFASVPIILSGRIVAVVGVANKEEPYGDGDVRQLQLLLSPVFSRIERTQAINKEKESLSLFQAIIDSVDDVVFTMDVEGRFTGLHGRRTGCSPCASSPTGWTLRSAS